MAGTFRVGSITAELVLDDTEFGQTIKNAINRTRQFGRDLRRALGGRAQIEFLQSRPVLNQINRISRGVRRLARTVRRTLGAAFRTALRFSVTAPIAALRRLGVAATRAGRRVTRAFGSGISRTLTRLRSTVFGLQGALAGLGIGLGAVGLTQRAREVENLRRSFEQLTGSVGENADAFLKDLRAATRGTVSDLELFRSTNNAVLLNVVESQEQFVELASIARRLGSAVGRDAVSALNDLSIGIGRQSRLILDNLGITVRVQEANDKYAASLGTTTSQLTDAQRRQAFLNATIDAAREKVATLGPDVVTLNDAFGRFTAQISNTATIVAEAFVGPGPFSAIADFLERNRENIRGFATFVAETVTTIFNFVSNAIGRLFSGGSFAQITENVARFIGNLVGFSSKLLGRLLDSLFGNLGLLILKLLAGLFAQIGNELLKQLTKLGAFIQNEGAAIVIKGLSKIPGVSRILDLDDTDKVEAALQRLSDAAERQGRNIEARFDRNRKTISDFVGDTSAELARVAASESAKVFEEIKDDVDDLSLSGSVLGEELVTSIGDINQSFDRFQSGASGAERALRDLSAQSTQEARRLAAISEAFRQSLAPFIQREQALELEVRTVGLEEAEAELVKFDAAFESIKDQLSEEDLRILEDTRERLSNLLNQRDARKEVEETEKSLESFTEKVSQFRDQVQSVEVGELAGKFRELRRSLDEAVGDVPQGLGREFLVRDLRVQFEEMADALARAEIAKVASELRDLDQELASIAEPQSVQRIRELESGFEEFARALDESGISADRTNALLREMRTNVDRLQEAAAFADLDQAFISLEESVQNTRRELDLAFSTDLERRISDINFEYENFVADATRATEALIEQRIAAGASAEEIDALRSRLRAFRQEADAARDEEIDAQIDIDKARETAESIAELADTTERALTNAIFEAFRNGEGAGKIFANILATFTEDAMRNAISNIVGFLQTKLTKLFADSAGGAGIGGLVTGILGIAGAILQQLDNQSSSQIDDFDSAINSSEAVRGVVAGPTNVAISKIGDSLKQAMQTTELLLEQILQTIQSGGGTPGGGGNLSGNSALPLSTSTGP